jgi:chromosome segregation ATPase
VGFIVAAYFSIMQEFDTVREQIVEVQSQYKKDIESLNEQIRQRYLTVLKQAQDIDQQQAKLAAIDRSITSEKEALGTVEDSFHSELAQMKKLGMDSNREVAGLEENFAEEIKLRELKLAKLQDDYQSMKNEVEDQQTLLVMMREQSLLDKYKQPQNGQTATDSATPDANGDGSSGQGPNGTLSVVPMPTTLVPTNNRVVTDLPSPSPVTTPTTVAPTPGSPGAQ